MLLFSDIHFDNYRSFSSILESGFNSRLIDQINVITEIKKLAEELGTENIVFLGDLINSYSEALPKIIYNAAFCAIRSLAEHANVYLILGNHDLYRGMNVLLPLSEIPNVSIVSVPTTINLEGYEIDMIPWGGSLPKQKAQVLMGHLAVQGAITSANGHKSEEGNFPTDLFGYQYIFLGHYHEPQAIPVKGATKAEYLGSVIQIDRGSYPCPRGILVFEKEGVNKRYSIMSPRIFSLTIDSQNRMDSLYSQIEKGDYWHLTVTNPNVNLPNFDCLFPHRVQVEYDIEPIMEVRLEEKAGEDLKEETIRFIRETKTAIDKERALELLDEIME